MNRRKRPMKHPQTMLTVFFVLAASGFLWCGCSSSPEVPQASSDALDPVLAGMIRTSREQVIATPRSADAWGRLGQAFDAAEFATEAAHCYQRAGALDPESSRWPHLLALRQLQDEPETALQNLARAATLASPTNDASRLRLAQALIERGRWTEAAGELRLLLAVRPDHPAARLELARVRLAENDPTEAARLLPPALTNAHTARLALLLLSQIRQREGNSTEAAELARRAAALPRPFDWPDPFLREVQSLRASRDDISDRVNELLRQRRLDEAASQLEPLLATAPDHAEGLLLLGRLRVLQQRCAEAGAPLRRHLELRPDSLHGWTQLGLAGFCDGRWSDAAAAFRRAVELKPDFAQGHYNLGLALARAGEAANAIACFRETLRIQPGNTAAHTALAGELWKTGQTAEAGREVEAALRIDPRNVRALALRERLASFPAP